MDHSIQHIETNDRATTLKRFEQISFPTFVGNVDVGNVAQSRISYLA